MAAAAAKYTTRSIFPLFTCHAYNRKWVVLGPHFIGGGDTHKSLPGFLLPADTRHGLKFRKSSFRGADEISSKNSNIIVKQTASNLSMYVGP